MHSTELHLLIIMTVLLHLSLNALQLSLWVNNWRSVSYLSLDLQNLNWKAIKTK